MGDMSVSVKQLIKNAVRSAGFELIRKRPHLVDLLARNDIDVVFDVGANEGQFGEYLRANGYRKRIVSFEPLPDAFDALQRKAAADGAWTAVNTALGASERTVTINVSRSTVYSSILPALPVLTDFAGASVEVVQQQTVPLSTLDAQFSRHVSEGERVFLKIDTQGYEEEVLSGAQSSLSRITGAQLELSLTPLYKNETPLPDMVALLERKGFRMALFEPVTYDKARDVLLQIDCVFFRDSSGS
jgi:FkbM family methyltransferase